MNKKHIYSITLLSSLLVLSSCNQGGPSLIKSEKSVQLTLTSSASENINISANDVKLENTLYTIEDKTLTNRRLMPSTGDVKVLILPLIMPGYENIDINKDGVDDKEKIREDLNTTFFGTGDELGFMSVKEYYYQSSYGKLNLSGYVCDWYDVKKNNPEYKNAAEIAVPQTYEIIQNAVNDLKNQNKIDLKEYDSDKDGYIDALWCIYSCPNYTKGGPRTDDKNYWAYTTWGNKEGTSGILEEPDVNDPVYSCFGWASYDFMYDGYGLSKLDSHTYIHEMGHFMGLKDYYGDSTSYSPVGKVDMMDGNIVDHNSYSKMILGWTKPTIVRGNTTINISSLINENSFIVIPSDETVIENNTFNPFSEYMVIELFTNEANNYKDSRIKYMDRPIAPTNPGVRIYHIDNRVFYADMSDQFNMSIKEYEGEEISAKKRLCLPICNYREVDSYNVLLGLDSSYNLFDEIRLIEASKYDTFSTGGYIKDKSLFKKGDTFSMNEYSDFFVDGLLNNKEAFTSTISIGEIK